MERDLMGMVAAGGMRPFQCPCHTNANRNAGWKEMNTWGRALHNRGLYGDE